MERHGIEVSALKRMGIPPLFYECTMSGIPDTCPHKMYLYNYIYSLETHIKDGVGLLLLGEYSTGKTAASCIVLKACLDKLKKVGLFISAKDIPRYVIEQTAFDAENTYYQRMLKVPLLVIDELALHSSDTYRDDVIAEVIRDRVYEKRSTIITTNQSREALMELDRPLVELMKEALIPIVFTGVNFRQQKAKILATKI